MQKNMIELGKNWAQKGRLSIRVDHYVAKNMVISASSTLGILLLVSNEDFTKKAKVMLCVETVAKNQSGLFSIYHMFTQKTVFSNNNNSATQKRLFEVLDDYSLLSCSRVIMN